MWAKSAAILCLCFSGRLTAGPADPKEVLPDGGPIVRNGGFEQADEEDASRPAHWDRPDGLGVQWTEAPAGERSAPRGRTIRMDTTVSEKDMVKQWRRQGITKWDIPNPASGPVAATYGLSLYSVSIPVKKGQAYRVQFDYMGASDGAKVWVRGYGLLRGETRRRYETIVFCRVPDGKWHTLSQVFHPTRLRPEVTEMKVMLYAYWPPGVYWFDNVRIEPITEAEYEEGRMQEARLRAIQSRPKPGSGTRLTPFPRK